MYIIKEIMPYRSLMLTLGFCAGFMMMQAQMKKKIHYYELDVIKGLYFQPYTKDPYTGLAFEDYPNEKRQLEMQIKDGKVDGKVKEWARNGKKVYEAEFEKGMQIGKEEQWYEDGFNKVLVSYDRGKAHGMCTEWHQTGGKKSLGEFVYGNEEGEHNWWFHTGLKDQTVSYVKGKEHGEMYAWHDNGAKKIEAKYVNGKLEGDYVLWYSNGQKKATKTFKDSLHVGEALFWGVEGRLTGRNVYGDDGVLKAAYNYNSGSVKIDENHYAQVFNTKDAHYMVALQADDRVYFVDDAKDITYSMDGMLLQCFAYPIKNKGSDKSGMQRTFDAFLAAEKKYIEDNTESEIEINQDAKVNKNGDTYFYWHFASPSSKDVEQKARTVQSEHYLTFICNDQLINLYSVVTNSDEPVKVLKMLQKVADTFQCEAEPIDLNALKKSNK